MNKEEPKVLTRMRLSCCWGDNLNEKELNEVVDYINSLQQENKQLKDNWNKLKEFVLKKQAVLNNTEYTCYSNYSNILDKMQEIEKESDNNE